MCCCKWTKYWGSVFTWEVQSFLYLHSFRSRCPICLFPQILLLFQVFFCYQVSCWGEEGELRVPHVSVSKCVTYRCACRSCSRSACSGRSSTTQTCTRSAGRVWPRVCCILCRSTAGCSRPAPWTSGCTGALWCPRCPAACPPDSSLETCWGRWAGVCLHGDAAGPSTSSSSWIAQSPACCARICPSDTSRPAQTAPSSSNMSSPRRSQKHRDNDSLWTLSCWSPADANRKLITPWTFRLSALVWVADVHLSPGLAVVLVHGAQRVATVARRHVLHGVVHELAAEPRPVLDVIWAAAPVPALCCWAAAPQPSIAAALCHVALAAGARDGMDEPCCHHRIDERCLFGSCSDRMGRHDTYFRRFHEVYFHRLRCFFAHWLTIFTWFRVPLRNEGRTTLYWSHSSCFYLSVQN